MIKDRGTIKWTAMMLPEHVQQLREFWNNDKRVQMPTIDEQQLEVMNDIFQLAYTEHSLLKITYYEAGRYLNTVGYINKINPLTKTLYIVATDGHNMSIHANQIITVELTEE
ncbi:YolD-like family protein [Calidifontibacillus oryziterrae]|uniref:YolD-like family protein n=1 Tax=Calidifontibacillus oryziterrae TaxID=1191699 RepID=UPI0003048BEB|nr:YolD-like family protein [Calidifontibacillus oryziterrae]